MRTGGSVMYARDAAYRYQADILKDQLRRLEVILEDEGVDDQKRERILRSMLYGVPSAADAAQRMRDQTDRARLLAGAPTRSGCDCTSPPGGRNEALHAGGGAAELARR